ncbi:hypothetical protein [Psychroserpens sp.]|jgi:hypothetical protein|uniref:hypothetical protein n=1 Tax=Psychroserpens sp. TaxID=2020870 RepID=UPI0039E2E1CB
MSLKKNNVIEIHERIVDLNNQGKSESEILNVFEQPPFNMNVNDEGQVEDTKFEIRHALGKATDIEIEAHSPQLQIFDFSVYDECEEGYLFQVETQNTKDDFYFLVDKHAINGASTIEGVYKFLNEKKEQVCKLLLLKVQSQHPFGVSCMPFESAKAKLTAQDFSQK